MAVVEGRTLIGDAETVASWTDEAHGTMSLALNTAIFIEGNSSLSNKVSGASTEGGGGWDYGTDTDLSGNVIYQWVNCSSVSALQTKAASGITMRFTGASATDWFEVELDGSDTYGGGWKMYVVDVDAAAASPDNQNGTPPTTDIIHWVGIVFQMSKSIAGGDDNCFWDAMWRLPASTAGIRVEGQNGGAPWTWADIVAASDTGSWGTAVEIEGVIVLNTPIQFGLDDATQDEFEDTGAVITWSAGHNVQDDLYNLTVLAGAGQSDFTAGTKVGTGETAVGVNGWTIVTAGPSWVLDFEDADQDSVGFYGCSFRNGGSFLIDDDAVEMISCTLFGCDTIAITGGATGPTVISNSFIDAPGTGPQIDLLANPLDGQFDFNFFANMSDFAIEISENGPVTYNLRGVTYAGNGTNGDIEFTHASGLVTLNVLELGHTPEVTQTGGGTNDVVNAVVIEVIGLNEGATVTMIATGGGDLADGSNVGNFPLLADDTGVATDTFNFTNDQEVIIRARYAGAPQGVVMDDISSGSYPVDVTARANSSGARMYSGTSIVIDEINDRFIRTVGSWIDDGFVEDQRMDLQGSASNDGIFTISTGGVTALNLDVEKDIITGEAAQTDLTITGDFVPCINSPSELLDVLSIGGYTKFTKIKITVTQPFDGTTNQGAWEYYNGSSWTTLNGVDEGTLAQFTVLGEHTVLMPDPMPSNWAKVSDASTMSIDAYWVRRYVTGTYGTSVPGHASKIVLDTTRYRPLTTTGTITDTGLSVNAVWIEDTIID